MIEQMSPAARKACALLLLMLVVLLIFVLVLQPIVGLVSTQLEQLNEARYARARYELLAAQPEPPKIEAVSPGLYIGGAKRPDAESALSALVGAAASRSKVTLERNAIVAMDQQSPTIAVDISVSGPEDAIATFIGDVEHGNPVLRFAQWQITAPDAPDMPTRLEAHTVAAWGRTQ